MDTTSTWGPGVILILIVAIIMAVPCVGVSLLGFKMLTKLAYYPSKTPAIQLSILVKLVIVQIISIALLLLFYHALSDYGPASAMLQKNWYMCIGDSIVAI